MLDIEEQHGEHFDCLLTKAQAKILSHLGGHTKRG